MLFVRYSYRQPKSSVPEFRYRALRGINWNLGKEEGVAGVAAFGFRRPKENTRGGRGGGGMDVRSFHHASLGIWIFGEEGGRVYLALCDTDVKLVPCGRCW